VGLGGAGFPTHIKLNYNESKGHVDSLVINAAECEPYITADYRTMIEESDKIIGGIKLVMKCLGIEKAYIGIEDNKPKAISLLKEKTANDDSISVVKLKSSYPQGAEKVIAFNCTGRIVKEGQLPSDQGIIVMNVSTAAFIKSYADTGMPLISKRLTVDGDIVKTPCNITAPIGTAYSEILAYAETNMEFAHKIISGGPMMGMCIYDTETPLCKTNNAILAFKEPLDKAKLKDSCHQTNCIKCGRCIKACPLGLMPSLFEKAYDRKDKETLNRLRINLCMNCGSCSYVCPAKRNLAEKNQLAKAFARS
jgi:electron transport complex protein RnfC